MPRIAVTILVSLFIIMLVAPRAQPQSPSTHLDQRDTETQIRGVRVPFQIAQRESATGMVLAEPADLRAVAPTPGSKAEEPIPLAPPSRNRTKGQSKPTIGSHPTRVATVVFSSLAIVLGLFFFVVWISRRASPRASASLPSDVLEVLGRAPLSSRHNLQLIRLGTRLLLVSVSTDGARTLAEISDGDEVNHLSGLCRQAQPGSITASFRHVLNQFGSPGAASPEFTDSTIASVDSSPGQGRSARKTGSR